MLFSTDFLYRWTGLVNKGKCDVAARESRCYAKMVTRCSVIVLYNDLFYFSLGPKCMPMISILFAAFHFYSIPKAQSGREPKLCSYRVFVAWLAYIYPGRAAALSCVCAYVCVLGDSMMLLCAFSCVQFW